jgi:hypothetical protein
VEERAGAGRAFPAPPETHRRFPGRRSSADNVLRVGETLPAGAHFGIELVLELEVTVQVTNLQGIADPNLQGWRWGK